MIKIIHQHLKKYLKLPAINFFDIRPRVFAWHINAWKRPFITNILSHSHVIYFPFKLTHNRFTKYWQYLLLQDKATSILVWGMNCPQYLKQFAQKHNIEITYVEDGFIRSVGLGSTHSIPMSLNFDKKTLYFNANEESDLEAMLNSYDFNNDIQLMERARKFKSTILEVGISKYNNTSKIDLEKIYGKKNKQRVFVVGQVEDDASIKYGCDKPMTNNDLVRLAHKENPHAQIIYKPHPDVLQKKRAAISNPNDISNIALVVKAPFPIDQALETIDHVYTITSQVGFEALLRGIPVTTVGAPFYSNWGVTDDRQSNDWRNRMLTVDEIFAASYILYPQYFNPITGEHISPEEALKILIDAMELS